MIDMRHSGQSRAITDAGPITYQVLRTLSDIEAISAQWDSLLDRSICNRAFSCSKWFLASCRLDRSFSPHVIVARRGAAICGILPLAVHNDLQITGFPSEMSDYNDIVAIEDDKAVLAGLLHHAISFGNGTRRLVLSRVRLDSNCLRAAQALLTAREMSRVFSVKGSSRYIRLSLSYEEYLKARSRNFRKSLARARRKVEKCSLAIRELEPQSFPASQLPEAFLSLNFDRWGAESYYELPLPRDFVLNLLPELFTQRRLRAFGLFKGERLLGLDLCMVGVNSLCTWNGGFLSEMERWSPGNLLIEAGIKHAYRMNLQEYDLLRGNEPYKERWTTSLRQIGWFDFNLYGPSSPERAMQVVGSSGQLFSAK